MSLPILDDIKSMQTNWAQQLNPVIELPTNQGLILKGVLLSSGTNEVSHRLGRSLQGWQIIRQRSAAVIYDAQDSEMQPKLMLKLVSSAPVSIDLFVF